MASDEKVKDILRKYLQDECSESEKAIVEAWYKDHADRPLSAGRPLPELSAVEERETGERILAELRRRLRLGGEPPVVRMRPRRRLVGYAAACVLLLAIGSGVWWMSRQRHDSVPVDQASVVENDIGPGGSKAVLTLGNGSRIVLDSVAGGFIARQGNSSVVQGSNGRLEYKASSGVSSDIVYNSLSTPAGGQYQLVLPDGTKVWLNALTTIKYPSSFTGGVRAVQVSGEAYFDVAKDEARPFRVTARDVNVEVLGTAFNVNCYDDEPSIRTSLLEGAVRLVRGDARLVLRPGEQAQTSDRGDLSFVQDADVEKAIAWKNGSFSFDNDNIQTIMRQLAKWYGVDIRYQGEPTHTIFGGTMRRTLSLQQVLSALSKYDVHFQLEGRTLVVMP